LIEDVTLFEEVDDRSSGHKDLRMF